MGMGALFMIISLSKPLKALSKIRPAKRLFHWSFVLTILTQVVSHFAVLFYLINLADPYIVRDESFVPDAEFKPNLKNSVVFIFSLCTMTTTFLVNYEGPPLTESFTQNAKFKKILLCLYGIVLASVMNVEMISEYLELVAFPDTEF
jgi:manganese-transporting P-type ATPase